MNTLKGKYINIEFKDEYLKLESKEKLKVLNELMAWIIKEVKRTK